MEGLQAIVDLLLEYKGWLLLIGIGLAALFFLRAYGSGLAKVFERWGQEQGEVFSRRVDINDTTREYLEQASTTYRRFKFRGLPRHRAGGIEPPQLDQAYVSVRVMRGAKGKETADHGRGGMEEAGRLKLNLEKAVGLGEALASVNRLAIVGVAGSGKSTLLQWAGQSFARALLKKTLTDEQKKFIAALGGRPLVPFLIPLRAYSKFCEKNQCSRSSKTLLNFMVEYFSDHHASLDLDVEFFKSHLQKGCLLMADGLDEVDPSDRPLVRSALEELLAEFDHPNLRCLLTTRPSAIHIAEQMHDFEGCEVQRLTKKQRNNLIELWYSAVLADDPREARRKASDLSYRLEDSDPRVQELATTPLMTTIFALVHYSRDELPKQRSRLYEEAIEVLLMEGPYKGEEALDLKDWGGMEWDVRRDRIARIAFELRERGKDSLMEGDLVDLIWNRFGNDEREARRACAHFLRDTAERGGLLEAMDDQYGFYTHATFQEYLAGRYLVVEYPAEKLPQFMREHVSNDLWEEPLRLAAGYLANTNEGLANKFVLQIAGAETNEESKARALYVAGLALADFPQIRRLPETVSTLLPQMEKLLSANPPRVGVRARFNLGLALGSLGDPRLKALEPDCLPVPGGAFRMGTNAEEEERMKAQEVDIYDDEKPAHEVYVSDFSIGKYPVTNLEYAAFYEDKGYATEANWSRDGWAWRTGTFDSKVPEIEDKDLRENYERWLKNRPVELRDKPFYWDNPQWNTPNLPVIGISWFEAEAYCNWLSQKTGKTYRLPTEAEWEKTARGVENSIWSWGDQWNGELCNNADKETREKLNRTSPVGIYPQGASDYGALDMMGNVWEWCSDWYDEELYQRSSPVDQKRTEETVKDPQGAPSGTARVVRGGSWYFDRNVARCAVRYWVIPVDFNINLGFRVVLSPEKSS